MAATADDVRREVTAHAGGSEGPLARFTEAWIARADPAFLARFGAPALAAMARQGYRFLDEAGGGPPAVRVRAPDADRDGWSADLDVVQVAARDRPFLVDSVRAELERRGARPRHLLHPVVPVERDGDGRIATLGDTGTREAYQVWWIDPLGDDAHRADLEAALRRVLDDVVRATDDYGAMRDRAHEVANDLRALADRAEAGEVPLDADALREDADFVAWLDEDHFVFLGYRRYDVVGDDDPVLQADGASALGILRAVEASAYRAPVPLRDLPPELRARVTGAPPLIVTKTNAEATVHRAARMDYVGVKRFAADGAVRGERRFLGLFTSKALATPVQEIPILRRKLRRVLALDGAAPGSHDHKQIVTIFDSMPRTELFWRDADGLWRDVRTVMALEHERDVTLTVRPDPLARGVAMMVVMPRERFDADVRRAIQTHLAARLDADHVDYTLAMGEEEAQVRFHFFFVTSRAADALDVPALEAEVRELSRTWADRVRRAAHDRGGDAPRRVERWLAALPDRYATDATPDDALADLALLDACAPGDDAPRVALRAGRAGTWLRIAHRRAPLALSDVLPRLENLGLRAIEQTAYPVGTDGLAIDVYRVERADGAPLDPARDGPRLVPAVQQILAGGVATGELDALVLSADLDLRRVMLLRALERTYVQIHVAASRTFVARTLVRHPAAAAALLDAFAARHDPDLPGPSDPLDGHDPARVAAVADADARFVATLADVASLAGDATLRGLHDLVAAVVRTNHYAREGGAIALKIDSGRVSGMPEPRPAYEIAVSGYGVEGVHLRGGRVARGGIRWSDRPDDVRTEVLGLMKTQTTKNAVIVPTGSKGGFVVEHAPDDPAELRAYVRRMYETFIGALLDVTDDRRDGAIIHPDRTVIHDDPDPYLVVAADKGTATFSDAANAIALARGFWLGDAFASGGEHGYDHKAEGITARGTWVSVRRHLRERGIDPDVGPVRTVGIGDMGGDVFGNGMLVGPHVHLLAAFDHRHVFLDPQPDPERAYAERRRRFGATDGSWGAYDPDALGPGGGVWPRDAKRIPLSDEARTLLDLDADAASGPEVVRAILRADVDLLWNGGVGTYVKAAAERHADVGDAANDDVRVDAEDLRASVVGEGGNLGFTQRARVAFARSGGRIDTDAIHNVGGVDMSDREVNLKIALQPAVASGALAWEDRNALLRSVSDEVADLVLADADRQALALSLAERRAQEDPRLFASLHGYLEMHGGLDGDVECLPGPRERRARLAAGETYVRPELAILLAYAKIGVQRRLLETDVPDDPHLFGLLLADVPRAVREAHEAALAAHPLRREMVATVTTNRVVDLLGPTFVHRTVRATGAPAARILRASVMATDLLDAPTFVAAVDGDASLTPDARYAAIHAMVDAVGGVVAWILQEGRAEEDMAAFAAALGPPLGEARTALMDWLAGRDARHAKRRTRAFVKAGLSDARAREVALLEHLPAALGAADVARTLAPEGYALDAVGRRFFALGERLRLGWLRDRIAERERAGSWERIAASGLVADLRAAQARLTAASLRAVPDGGPARLERWLTEDLDLAPRLDALLARAEAEEALDLPAATVLVRTVARAA
ncbi:MAG: NAD-glutamate dehydrogenase [Trueperaceae bacterium]|nr:NAD-glutamate dehydrogenase [Trueperaceae bacterium]